MRRIKGEKCRLSDLKIGQQCKILSNEISQKQLRLHLLEMGLIPETVVKIKKIAPFRNTYSNRGKRIRIVFITKRIEANFGTNNLKGSVSS